MLKVRIWGSRGSIPCPGASTVEFGGNTACLEIRADDKLAIVDMGTGIRSLGDWLMEHDFPKGPIDADIFVTHTHWDHIMGFPMFTPLFIPTTKLRVRGPVSYGDDTMESIISTLFSIPVFAVTLSRYSASRANPLLPPMTPNPSGTSSLRIPRIPAMTRMLPGRVKRRPKKQTARSFSSSSVRMCSSMTVSIPPRNTRRAK
ncbi:hypothetical protein AGMMS49940_23450 [Spirochaetia bacterium]|nr:hypothetical protein AGMMS49940_23450 [Spirochaetia bacterium]